MNSSRNNILMRLRANPGDSEDRKDASVPEYDWSQAERIERLSTQLQQVRAEVHLVRESGWIEWLNNELPRRGLHKILTGNTPEGSAFKQQAHTTVDVQLYTAAIEEFKQAFFSDIEAGLTTTRGGIADTGSLILWPDEVEPRLLSLVPPVHIALLKADEIFETFAQAIQHQQWQKAMPTNALLISGPSKTADIQQTLAYGIHGPKELIVLILE
jgi:L-lactate dehydrogenase complex protein LldG